VCCAGRSQTTDLVDAASLLSEIPIEKKIQETAIINCICVNKEVKMTSCGSLNWIFLEKNSSHSKVNHSKVIEAICTPCRQQ